MPEYLEFPPPPQSPPHNWDLPPNPLPIQYVQLLKEVQGDRVHYDTGAQRSADRESVRYDLISPLALRRLAATYAEGAAKYGARNWEKGMPESDLLNHAIAHIYLHLTGDTTEDHMAHAAWNLFAVMHFQEISNPSLA